MPILSPKEVLLVTGEPPTGDTKLVDEIDSLVKESTDHRTMPGINGMSKEDMWERNGRRYIGDHWDAVGGEVGTSHIDEAGREGGRSVGAFAKYTINRTQGAIIAQRARAFGRPETFRFEPVESSDDGVMFVKPMIGSMVLRSIQTGQISLEDTGLTGFTEEQLRGLEPIPSRFEVELLNSGVFNFKDFFRINDLAVARAIQIVWGRLYSQVKGSYYVATNSLYTAIFGFHPMLFEWDTSLPGFKLTNPHILNVWIDPTAETVEEAEYVILDSVISADRAKRAWPALADTIDEAASSGGLNKSNTRIPETQSLRFNRSMLVVRTAWLRFREVDMTVEEAREDLKVEPVDSATDKDGADFRIVETGGKTKPGASNWPQKPGILQVQTLPQISQLIEKVRCPYKDIPIGWNKNIPVPYSAYGQGEPERVESLQQAINRLFTILHRHARYYQAPMEFWPEDLYNEVKSSGGEPYAEPGRIVPVRQDIFELLVRLGGSGGFGVINQIPPIPSFYVRLLELLLEEHDRISGHADVIQGTSPGSETSGRAIEALQAAAQGPIEVKSFQTEQMLQQIGEIGLDAIKKWLPEAVWSKILNQYPVPVLRYIRGEIDSREFNVKVTLVSGKGVSDAFNAEQAANLYMGGSPSRLLSRRSAMDLSGVHDPDREERLIDQENEELGLVPPTEEQAVE